MKKAMIEVQFNWIFILIVGVIILLFFISLSFWMKENQEKKWAEMVLTQVQTVLSGAEANSETASEINVPPIELRFTCDPDNCGPSGCTSGYQFENSGVSKENAMDIVFTQNALESDFIHAWTLKWNAPYKVANLVCFSTKKVKFYLVYEDGNADSEALARAVMKRMKDNIHINPSIIDHTQVEDQDYRNEYLVRFAFFFEPSVNIDVSNKMEASRNWDVIFIVGDESSGEVKFSKRDGDRLVVDEDAKYPYLGMPTLIGAIYSEDYEYYKCNMKKAFIKMKTVNEIYSLVSADLYDYYAGDMICEYYYDAGLMTEFARIDQALTDLEEPDINQLNAAMNAIEDTNKMTEQRSCTRIY